jgi:hypothetical protein
MSLKTESVESTLFVILSTCDTKEIVLTQRMYHILAYKLIY